MLRGDCCGNIPRSALFVSGGSEGRQRRCRREAADRWTRGVPRRARALWKLLQIRRVAAGRWNVSYEALRRALTGARQTTPAGAGRNGRPSVDASPGRFWHRRARFGTVRGGLGGIRPPRRAHSARCGTRHRGPGGEEHARELVDLAHAELYGLDRRVPERKTPAARLTFMGAEPSMWLRSGAGTAVRGRGASCSALSQSMEDW